MVAHNQQLLLEHALARRQELYREADLHRLLRHCRSDRPSHLDRWLAAVGVRLVCWGTSLQQRSSGATTPSLTL